MEFIAIIILQIMFHTLFEEFYFHHLIEIYLIHYNIVFLLNLKKYKVFFLDLKVKLKLLISTIIILRLLILLL